MNAGQICVWFDHYGRYDLVGTIEERGSGLSFAYHPDYQGPAISAGMPLSKDPFSSHRTETFFHALAPPS